MRYPIMKHALQQIKIAGGGYFQSIIDVGILTGTKYLMDAFPSSYHYLFEPVRQYHVVIESNYTRAKIEHKLFPIALSDEPGKNYLHEFSYNGSGNITHSGIFPTRDETMSHLVAIQEVDVSTLDQIFANSSLPPLTYLVKIDVDGLETKIIKGGNRIIADSSFVIVEAPLGQLTERAACIEKLGFRLFDVVDPAYYCKQLWQVDILFINNRLRDMNITFRPRERTDNVIKPIFWEHFQGKG